MTANNLQIIVVACSIVCINNIIGSIFVSILCIIASIALIYFITKGEE